MNADGTNPVPLTNTGLAVLESWPAWSPDGAMIVWSSGRDNHNGRNSEIYVMNADGTNQTRLTFNDENDGTPDWSADGSKIIFHSKRDLGNAELYVMNPDGSNQVNLTNSPEIEGAPDWSHDGAKIAFHTSFLSPGEIWAMNADASGRRNLTNNPANDFNPTWAPVLAPPPPPPAARIEFFGPRAQAEAFQVPQASLPDIDPGQLFDLTQGVKGHDRSLPSPQEPFRGSVAYLHLSSPQPGTAPYAMSSTAHEGFESLAGLGPEQLSFDFQGTNMLTGNIIHRHDLTFHDPMSLNDPLFDILDNVVYFIEEGTLRAMEKRTYLDGTWSILNNADDSVIATGTIEYITLFLDYSTEENTGWGLVRVNPGSAFFDDLMGNFGTDSLALTIDSLQSPVFNDEPPPLILRNAAGYAVFGASVSVSPAEAPG